MVGSVESNTSESEHKEANKQLPQPNHQRKLGRKVKKLDQKISANGIEKFKEHLFIFFYAYERAESSKSYNLIGSESGQFFTMLPANPDGVIGSFIHKFVCLL